MTYPKRVLIAIDQLFAVVLFGTHPDETISAMAHRRGWKRLERLINWLFRDPLHCARRTCLRRRIARTHLSIRMGRARNGDYY